ncbi:MAG: Uma2 family endonuclease [Deltaproteobacteria bacterium]|nr:Uma2 family endonuclease [Deltaproteobacteria bacterium]
MYEENGVDEYWIVDPMRKRITVFTLTATGYDSGVSYARGAIRSRLLPGLTIPLAELFRSPFPDRRG